RAGVDLEWLKGDLRVLIDESQEGVSRVRQIVQGLKEFSHVDHAEWCWSDLHAGLDSTLNIIRTELKHKAKVIKEYAGIPMVRCVCPQHNQLSMTSLVNAEKAMDQYGVITTRTSAAAGSSVWVEVADTSSGIAHEDAARLFGRFFTTKTVGTGTGLGL